MERHETAFFLFKCVGSRCDEFKSSGIISHPIDVWNSSNVLGERVNWRSKGLRWGRPIRLARYLRGVLGHPGAFYDTYVRCGVLSDPSTNHPVLKSMGSNNNSLRGQVILIEAKIELGSYEEPSIKLSWTV